MELKEPSGTTRGRGASSRGTQVYQSLIGLIRSGRLTPGMRMREGEIAELLGVSRTPVREALARLQARGLVDYGSGGMAIVELSRPRIMELYAMRAVLEGAAARFAAENASAGDLATLEHVSRLFVGYEGDARGLAALNAHFHRALYEAAHNSYLSRMLDDLNDSLALLPNTTFSVEGRRQAATEEHDRILKAVLARKADRAEAEARRHIGKALEARLQLLF
jgi:DNA-binding GntR family transcriptional regulator